MVSTALAHARTSHPRNDQSTMNADPSEPGRPEEAVRKECDHLNAELFLDRYGEVVRWSPELNRWFVWNGSWWERDRLAKVREMARDTIDGLRRSIGAPGSAVEVARRASHYKASAKASRMKALLDVASVDPGVRVSVSEMDAHPMLLACLNGTIDLSSGELRNANPDDLLTRGVKLKYSPEATSSVWQGFIEAIFRGDQELIDFAQRLMGYCCTGSVREQILPIFYGVGQNGKSTFVGTLQRILGDHAITAPAGLLIQQRYTGHEEMFAELRGRRLAVSFELEDSCSLAEQRIKMLTGGDLLTARELYGSRFYFEPTHKNLLVTNHKPRIAVSDHAIRRRVLMMPFDFVVPKQDKDSTLGDRLFKEEGEAVLAWTVVGAVAWSKEGLGTSRAVSDATQEYQEDQDRVRKFLNEATVPAQNERCKVSDLYEQWRAWGARDGESPGRPQDFRWALEHQGLLIRSVSNVQFVLGITLSKKYGIVQQTMEERGG